MGSDQRGPPLLRRLLQDLQQQLAERLGDGGVASRRQVEEVEHVPLAERAVGLQEARAHVQQRDLAGSWQPGAQKAVHCCVLLPQRVWPLTAGQQTLVGYLYVSPLCV